MDDAWGGGGPRFVTYFKEGPKFVTNCGNGRGIRNSVTYFTGGPLSVMVVNN